MKNRALLQNMIDYIDAHITEKITVEALAEASDISAVYAKKLFSSVFHLPVSVYIRRRKLSLSAEELLRKDFRVSDIAVEYGYEFSQTYINAFKKEFGVTPYRWKQRPEPLVFTEKLSVSELIELENGSIVAPEVVLLPALLLSGVKHTLEVKGSRVTAPAKALSFWENEAALIEHVREPGVYYGVTKGYAPDKDTSDYYCTVCVSERNAGFENFFLKTSHYAKFSYIGNHSYKELSVQTAASMYGAIKEYFDCNLSRRFSFRKDLYFERVDTRVCSDNFCLMQWYIPYE